MKNIDLIIQDKIQLQNTLKVLLWNIDKLAAGLCLLAYQMAKKDEITFKEYSNFRFYLEKQINIFDYGGYLFTEGKKEPRINFLIKEINKLEAEIFWLKIKRLFCLIIERFIK
jgi:hypothetical protein